MKISLLLILIGIFIRLLSIRHMGIFNLVVEDAKTIQTDGIYKYARHPSYVGTMFMLAGISLISIHLALLYLAFMFFLSRAIQEESILLNNSKYREYHQKTGMFIPKIKTPEVQYGKQQ